MTPTSEDRDGVTRLSHRLVAMHVAGVAILILVVLSSVIWVSAEHNRLALESSESMVRGGIANLLYPTSKGAVVNMTRALAIDHGPQGIRVNSVNPGDVNTGMLREEARQLAQDDVSFLAEAADRPLGRMGEPREVAAASFCVSPASRRKAKRTQPARKDA